MTEKPVIGNFALVSFVFLSLGALYYSIPSDIELAGLQTGSAESAKAEALLKEALKDNAKSPLLKRRLMEVSEVRGDIRSALARAKELTLLRPKNEKYWESYIRLLEWVGQPLKAVRATESAMMKGAFPITRDALMEVAAQYEWYQKYDDLIRIYQEVRKRELSQAGDVDQLIRILLNMGKTEAVVSLVNDAVEKKQLKKEAYLDLYSAFLENKFTTLALQSAARYLNASEKQIQSVERSVDYVTSMKAGHLRQQKKIVLDLVWVYSDVKKTDLSIQIMEKLDSVGLLERKNQLVYLEFLIERKKEKDVREAIVSITSRGDFSPTDWKWLAQRLLWKGQKKMALKILEKIVQGKSPKSVFQKRGGQFTPGYGRDPRNLLASAFSLADFDQEADLVLSALGATEPMVLLAANDKLDAYWLMVEAHDGEAGHGQSIQTLERMLKAVRSGEIKANQKDVDKIQLKLAERYYWSGRHYQLAEFLRRRDYSTLTPNEKGYLIVANYEVGRGATALNLLNEFPQNEWKKVDKDLRKQLDEIRDGPITIREKESGVDALEYSGRFIDFEAGLDNSATLLAPGANAFLHLGSNQSRFAFLTKLEGSLKQQAGISTGMFRLGGEFRGAENFYSLEAGYLFGGRTFKPQLRFETTGTLFVFDYASTVFELAKPLNDSRGLVENGVSESRIETYFERRFGAWVEAVGSVNVRWTHIGDQLGQGFGADLLVQAPLGHETWRLKAGPWFQMVRWGTDSSVLPLFLSRRLTILGPYARLKWGGKTANSWGGKISTGIGADFDAEETKLDALFVELEAEKLITKTLGFRFMAALYTSSRTIGDATFLTRLGVVQSF